MNLTLRQLRAFAAVADAGSFTEAARRLHLTQSALSVLVRELERELGVRVLDRSTRRVQLSDPGRDFHPYVQRVLNELGEAVTSVGNLRDKKKGLLRVAAPQLMACTLMPRVIAAYGELYPDVQVRLTDTPPERTLDVVLSGDAELAVAPDGGAGPELARRPLLRDRHWLICPPGHALMRKQKVRWKDLAGAAFIAPTRDFMQRLQPALIANAKDVALAPVHEVSFMTTALGMVAAGIGLTAAPSYSAPLVAAYGLEMRLLVEPVFYRDVCIFSSASKTFSPAAQSFVDFLHRYVSGKVKR
jgi:DNA-binding transcriptional LysR family regulator